MLARLLEAWRETRAIELAPLIEHASAIAAHGRSPITGGSQRALHAAWLAVDDAGDPADVDRLLAVLGNGNLTQAKERIARLARRPADPRIAAGLEALLASPPSVAFVKGTSIGLWDAVFAELARIADPRTRTIHERLAWLAHDRATSPFDTGKLRSRTSKAVATVAQAIAPAGPPPPWLDEVAAQLRAMPVPVDRGAELLARIYDDPRDLDARAVYADWLSTNGDPRGELIALQLARGVQHDEMDTYGLDLPARERTLLRTHQSRWVGRLGALLESVHFERGFPYRGQLAPNVRLAALAIPEASTLAHLSLDTNDPRDGRLLAERPFHGLVTVSALGWDAFAALATAPTMPSIRGLRVSDEAPLPSRPDGLDAAWPLAQLDLDTSEDGAAATAEQIRAFMRAPLVRRLRMLRVAYAIRNDRAFVGGFVESEVERLELDTWSYLFDLAVDRDDGAPRTRIVVRYNDLPNNRASTVPLLRERARTWPRELVDVAHVELDARYAEHAPADREQILAAAGGFAGELHVTETKTAARGSGGA